MEWRHFLNIGMAPIDEKKWESLDIVWPSAKDPFMHQWRKVIWFKSIGMKRGKERPKITLVEIVKMNILVKEVTKVRFWIG